MAAIIKQLMDNLEIDIHGKPQWTNDPPGRATWEWRKVNRAFGTNERKSLIKDLQHWNDALKNCFEKPEVPLDETDLIVQKMQSLLDPMRFELLRASAQVMHRALQSGWTCVCVPPHRGSIELDRHSDKRMMPIVPSTFIVAFSFTQVQQCQHNPYEEFWQKTRIEVEEPKQALAADAVPAPSTPIQSSNKIQPRKNFRKLRFSSLFEPFSAPPPTTSPSTDHLDRPPGTSHPSSIHCLCDALQKAHLGTFGPSSLWDPDPSQTRRVIITHHPKRTSSLEKSIPLKAFLSRESRPPHLQLSRKQRFGIAAAVAWAVLHLCGSPWLGDTWSREDVHLFLESRSTGRESLANNPCLSYIFGSTPSLSPSASILSTAATDFQNSLIRNKAIFALGVLLIELCLPCSFEQLRRQQQQQQTANIQAAAINDYEIALSKIDEVYLDAGDSYGYAVQRCLRLEFPGREIEKNFDFRQFRQIFHHHIVAPIQAY